MAITPRSPNAELRVHRTLNVIAGQERPPNEVWASPDGVKGVPLFRNLVAGDISGLIPGLLPVTTKGDLLGFDTAPDRLPVGSNGRSLFADSSLALGLGWKGGTQTLSVNVTPVSNVGVGVTNLMSVVIPAGAINVNVGDSLELEALFGTANGGGTVTVTVTIAGVTFLTVLPNGNGGNMLIRSRIMRITSATQIISSEAISNIGVSTATAFNSAANLAGAVTIQFTGQATGGSAKITQLSLHAKICTA